MDAAEKTAIYAKAAPLLDAGSMLPVALGGMLNLCLLEDYPEFADDIDPEDSAAEDAASEDDDENGEGDNDPDDATATA